MRTLSKTALAVALMLSLVPCPAYALSIVPVVPVVPKAPTVPVAPVAPIVKPVIPAHEDVPPALAGEAAVAASEPQSLPADPVETAVVDAAALAAEDAAQALAPAAHPVDAAASLPAGEYELHSGDGRNGVTFGSFKDGDIIVVLDQFSLGHAGIFDQSAFVGYDPYAVISANVKPVNGVQRERCSRYRLYDRAYGLWVPAQYHHRTQARLFAQRQIGKPYVLSPDKTGTRTFYCSKLAWCAWYYTARVDLDGDGGLYVAPVDLITSRHTALFGRWN